jgi:hypothetical protein
MVLQNNIMPCGYRNAASIRPAMTLIEVLVVVFVGLALVGIFFIIFPSRVRWDCSHRFTCSANLKGIGTGLYTYANENNGMWPIAPSSAERVQYAPKIIGLNRGDGKDPESGKTTEQDTKVSPTRSLWMLVRIGASSAKAFICPTSSDSPNQDDDPQLFWDFKNWNEVSYGYQVSYGKNGQPSSNCDGGMILAADKGPYSAALENGQTNPGIPDLTAAAGPDDWRKWNSPNHSGEGQVVLFADSHAGFIARPNVGIKNDNIYTRWSGQEGYIEANESARAWGTPPTSNETPWSDTDTLIYP